MDEKPGLAPLLSVIGGKITTYRRLAEAVLERLAAHLPLRQGLAAGWTGTTPLPGGEFDPEEMPLLAARLARSYPFLAEAHADRLTRAYGARAARVLGRAKSAADLGQDFGATLTEAEVRYLIEQEWARTAEDVVWRRSKLGLRLSTARDRGTRCLDAGGPKRSTRKRTAAPQSGGRTSSLPPADTLRACRGTKPGSRRCTGRYLAIVRHRNLGD